MCNTVVFAIIFLIYSIWGFFPVRCLPSSEPTQYSYEVQIWYAISTLFFDGKLYLHYSLVDNLLSCVFIIAFDEISNPSGWEESSCLKFLLDKRDALLGPWVPGRYLLRMSLCWGVLSPFHYISISSYIFECPGS
jgi:hypothetical protein